MVLGRLDNCMQKKNTGLLLHTIDKNQLNSVNNLNIKLKTIKLLTENIVGKQLDIYLAMTFWIWHQKQSQQRKHVSGTTSS